MTWWRLTEEKLRGHAQRLGQWTRQALGPTVIAGVVLLACSGARPQPTDVPLLPPFVPLTAPGAAVDRVGLPERYRERFAKFFENDRVAMHDVHVAYINATGAQVQEGQPFPYGTIIALETFPAMLTPDGQIKCDATGRFVRGDLATIFVMRKEPGFGEKYGQNRTGEWEYADYRPDGTLAFVPEMTQVCAQCHMRKSNAQQDWIIGANRFFEHRRLVGDEPAAPSPASTDHLKMILGIVAIALAASSPILIVVFFASRSLGPHR